MPGKLTEFQLQTLKMSQGQFLQWTNIKQLVRAKYVRAPLAPKSDEELEKIAVNYFHQRHEEGRGYAN